MTKQDELKRFQELARMADRAFQRAELAERRATDAKQEVRSLLIELKDRIEALEIELDIPPRESESEDSDENDDGDCLRKQEQEDRFFGGAA